MTRKTRTKADTAQTAIAPNKDASPPDAADARSGSKIRAVIALLEREEGATLPEMIDATGWQPHSARAVLTGLRKKGHVIVKSKRDDTTCYRITATA